MQAQVVFHSHLDLQPVAAVAAAVAVAVVLAFAAVESAVAGHRIPAAADAGNFHTDRLAVVELAWLDPKPQSKRVNQGDNGHLE